MCDICKEVFIEFEKVLHNSDVKFTQKQLSEAMEACKRITKCEHGAGNERPKHENDIVAELHDAEKYYNRYVETKDSNFKQLAKDELRHADYFIKLVRSKTLDPAKQEEIQRYTDKYNELLNKLSNPY